MIIVGSVWQGVMVILMNDKETDSLFYKICDVIIPLFVASVHAAMYIILVIPYLLTWFVFYIIDLFNERKIK